MTSALHADALALLQSWQAPDDRQEELRRAYVDHLRAHSDGTDRACPGAHLTAGAVVLAADRDRVLLTLHAKARRWFQMGGHCEAGDPSLAAAALREATEESGIEGLRIDPEPIHLDTHVVGFCGDHASVAHLDVRFLALAPEDALPRVSEESLDVRWWPVDAPPSDDPEMHELVRRALERAGQSVVGSSPDGS